MKDSIDITIPGSKSYTNRALILSALANSKVKILNPLISDDTKAVIHCLKKLGIKILVRNNFIEVLNHAPIKDISYDLDANESGTTIRFMLALSTIIPGIKILSGKAGLNKRPIKELVEGLRQLGAKIEYLDKEGFPPIRVSPSKLKPGIIKIKGDISSQYISALLMIAPIVGKITIEVIGKQISKPYIDMTIDTMKQFGVIVSNKSYKTFTVSDNQKYKLNEYPVEGDFSSASYFFAIAALTKSTITVKNLNPKSKQADIEFLKILEKMGSKIIFGKDNVTIIGKGIKPVSANMQDCPDQIQTLSVLAAFANGITKISGIESLRIKETDRVKALTTELNKMGIKTTVTKSALTIYGGNPEPAQIDTSGDHRMAMSFAVASIKLPEMQINDPEVVNKTFPGFWKTLSVVEAKIKLAKDKNIVLIGMRGSGKTTIAKLLSKKLSKEYLELDKILAEKTGMSISEIVEKNGWDYFRKQESKIIKEVALHEDKIISTGGGMITRPENIDALKKNGVFVWLQASFETLLKRSGHNSNRPALTDKKTIKEELAELLKQRAKLYRQSADIIIKTDQKNKLEIVNQITREINL